MPTLTDEMKRVVAEQKLGFVASVCADGTPNLSPKGTFLVRDDDHLMFGEIRSPQTVSNIVENPAVEINFVDALSRIGFRCKGQARMVSKGSSEFDNLLPAFVEQWDDFCDLFNGIIVVRVDEAKRLFSPAYDIGSKEEDLRRHYLAYFSEINDRRLVEVQSK